MVEAPANQWKKLQNLIPVRIPRKIPGAAMRHRLALPIRITALYDLGQLLLGMTALCELRLLLGMTALNQLGQLLLGITALYKLGQQLGMTALCELGELLGMTALCELEQLLLGMTALYQLGQLLLEMTALCELRQLLLHRSSFIAQVRHAQGNCSHWSRRANLNELVNDVTSPAGCNLQLAECVVHWIYCSRS